MSAIDRYLTGIKEKLDLAAQSQAQPMEDVARLLADTTQAGGNLFAFGCNHAGLLALELYYRTGGMVTINPVKAPGLMLDLPHTLMTSDMERMEGYGSVIFKYAGIQPGDAVIIHSVSGRNAATIDFALQCRQAQVKVIVLTNMNTTTREPSRHSSGKNLYELGDIIIDNCGDYGDAMLEVDGFPQKIAPSSTAVGAALLNAIVARAIELLVARGINPPVFISSNVEGGDAHNKAVLDQYSDHVFYL